MHQALESKATLGLARVGNTTDGSETEALFTVSNGVVQPSRMRDMEDSLQIELNLAEVRNTVIHLLENARQV